MTPTPRQDAIVKVQMPALTSALGYVTVQGWWGETGRAVSASASVTVQRWRDLPKAAVTWEPIPQPHAQTWDEEKP